METLSLEVEVNAAIKAIEASWPVLKPKTREEINRMKAEFIQQLHELVPSMKDEISDLRGSGLKSAALYAVKKWEIAHGIHHR